MKAWLVLLTKEARESWRSFKFLWIPLVFLSLGVSEPLTNYFMEDILQAVGNMPEDFAMMMPELSPTDLILSSTGQFQLIGIIVLISVFIGAISRERSNGTATLIYMRPISAAALYMSKWMIASLVAITCTVLGYAGSIYYISVLYESIPMQTVLTVMATYSVWMLFVMAVTITLSAAFNTGVAAAIAIIIIPIGQMVDSIIGGFWTLSPWKLASYGVLYSTGSIQQNDYWLTLLITVALTLLSIGIGIWATKSNRALTKV